MTVELSIATIVSCRCALVAHLKNLKSMADSASTIEFKTICEEQIETYHTALAEVNKLFRTYDYE